MAHFRIVEHVDGVVQCIVLQDVVVLDVEPRCTRLAGRLYVQLEAWPRYHLFIDTRYHVFIDTRYHLFIDIEFEYTTKETP